MLRHNVIMTKVTTRSLKLSGGRKSSYSHPSIGGFSGLFHTCTRPEDRRSCQLEWKMLLTSFLGTMILVVVKLTSVFTLLFNHQTCVHARIIATQGCPGLRRELRHATPPTKGRIQLIRPTMPFLSIHCVKGCMGQGVARYGQNCRLEKFCTFLRSGGIGSLRKASYPWQ